MHRYKNSKGFSLIELLVVIAIISVLISMIITALNTNFSDQTRLTMIRDAVQEYEKSNNGFPLSDQVNGTTSGTWVYQLVESDLIKGGKDFIEIDTKTKTGVFKDTAGNPIHFRIVGEPGTLNMTVDQYRKASNTFGAFFVWTEGNNKTDDFTNKYSSWNVALSDRETFEIAWNQSEEIDDLVVWGDS